MKKIVILITIVILLILLPMVTFADEIISTHNGIWWMKKYPDGSRIIFSLWPYFEFKWGKEEVIRKPITSEPMKIHQPHDEYYNHIVYRHLYREFYRKWWDMDSED